MPIISKKELTSLHQPSTFDIDIRKPDKYQTYYMKDYKIINSDYHMLANEFLLVDTSNNEVTVTLPSIVSDYDKVFFHDFKGTFNTNKLSIAPNENQTIMGSSDNLDITDANVTVKLMYVNGDWRIIQ